MERDARHGRETAKAVAKAVAEAAFAGGRKKSNGRGVPATAGRLALTLLTAVAISSPASAAPPPAKTPAQQSQPTEETAPRPVTSAEPSPAEPAADAGPTAAEPADQPGVEPGLKPGADASLDALEQRAAADPDDLRAGAELRQRCIAEKAYDRCIDFFAKLSEEHPDSAAAHLNWGYAYVDEIPAAGAVTQVILADTALKHFSEAVEIDDSWLALYTRGNSYVYWPAIFGRTKLGIADLDKAVAKSVALGDAAPPYHAHAYAALGDAYWRLGDLATARSWWRKGLDRFPDDAPLRERLELDDAALDDYLHGVYEIGQRVDTGLAELWETR